MIEKIYTIPVNEAFDLYSGCPICSLYKKLEDIELDTILGAAMMEPDIRIETNKKGFCGKHFDIMFNMKNRLALALMIESHLSLNINKALKGGLFNPAKNSKKLDRQSQSCYVCDKIEFFLIKMLENTVLLWEREREFKQKLLNQPYFCINHYSSLLYTGEYSLSKKLYSDFSDDCKSVMIKYGEKLLADVSWFVKKFDYNYENEPWGDSKDAVERAIKFLSEYKNLDMLRR
ncbi:MAG: DUF6062 family protein [Oscillospiraceae bacterium]|nr:DUF6062 family protein [Oscillospiraceae bacterium]